VQRRVFSALNARTTEGGANRFAYFAIRDLRLELQLGQVMGFVGPNGAGKSTTLKLLMALVQQDGGDIRAFGYSMPRDQATPVLAAEGIEIMYQTIVPSEQRAAPAGAQEAFAVPRLAASCAE
jgi:ABC-type multidrug transport system ATPase subunit